MLLCRGVLVLAVVNWVCYRLTPLVVAVLLAWSE